MRPVLASMMVGQYVFKLALVARDTPLFYLMTRKAKKMSRRWTCHGLGRRTLIFCSALGGRGGTKLSSAIYILSNSWPAHFMKNFVLKE